MKKSYFTGNSHPLTEKEGMANKSIRHGSIPGSSFFHFKGSGEIVLWEQLTEAVQLTTHQPYILYS